MCPMNIDKQSLVILSSNHAFKIIEKLCASEILKAWQLTNIQTLKKDKTFI